MARPPSVRSVGELTSPEVSQCLQATSILCLPIGAIEQHGAHLPLDTDVVVAEELTRRIVARWGDELDLWQLPTVSIGLSREHDWAPGTLSLSIQNFVSLLRDLARNIVRALPARNLAIVNGHGGNRGVLDNLIHELRGDFALNACVIHPFDLAKVDMSAAGPDVHGGRSETSVMLALAPQRVRRACCNTAVAPTTRRERSAGFPIFEIFPKRSFPPLECIFGVNPIHAAKCRPDLKAPGSGTNALIVAAVIGPTPGIVASRRMVSSRRTSATISRPRISIRTVSPSI